MKIIKLHQDFLVSEHTSQSLIVVNPPWAKIGVAFIEKSIRTLKPNGDLVGIMDYNKFTRFSSTKDSLFKRMQKMGHFKFISTDVSWGNGYFKSVADSVHFVWQKNPEGMSDGFYDDYQLKPTIIKNRNQEKFTYQLLGNEQYVPQLKNDLDFFDWEDGIFANSCGSKMTFNEDKFAVFLRRKIENCIFKCIPKGQSTSFGGCTFPVSGDDAVDVSLVTNLIKENSELFYNNYTVSHGWPRFPPFKRDLLQKESK